MVDIENPETLQNPTEDVVVIDNFMFIRFSYRILFPIIKYITVRQ